jgi:hypothetical protein
MSDPATTAVQRQMNIETSRTMKAAGQINIVSSWGEMSPITTRASAV